MKYKNKIMLKQMFKLMNVVFWACTMSVFATLTLEWDPQSGTVVRGLAETATQKTAIYVTSEGEDMTRLILKVVLPTGVSMADGQTSGTTSSVILNKDLFWLTDAGDIDPVETIVKTSVTNGTLTISMSIGIKAIVPGILKLTSGERAKLCDVEFNVDGNAIDDDSISILSNVTSCQASQRDINYNAENLRLNFNLVNTLPPYLPDESLQRLDLTVGWNWVGFHVLPDSHKVADVLGKTGFSPNDIVQRSSGSTRFTGASWLPGSYTLDYGRMYQIYASKPNTVLIAGADNASASVPLVSGWNWISNPTGEAAAPSDLTHSGGWTAGDRIQSTGRTVTFTGSKWLPSTGVQLEPGLGYQMFTAKAGTLTFPSAGGEEDETLYAVVDLSGGSNASSYPVRYSAVGPDLNDDTCRTTELWLRKVPAGTFLMGSPDDEAGHSSNETLHEVTLTQDYYIGVFECTQRQWELVMGNRPSYFSNDTCYTTRPVEYVSYTDIRGTSSGIGWPGSGHVVDATSFMGKLRARTGLEFDLPTEAQWEYACRAGMTTALNTGRELSNPTGADDAVAEAGRYRHNGGAGYSSSCTDEYATAKVGSYLPNAWGLFDMHGNVSEWCLDRFGEYGTETTDPVGATTTVTSRVKRGGDWNSSASRVCRSANRQSETQTKKVNSIGFRLSLQP